MKTTSFNSGLYLGLLDLADKTTATSELTQAIRAGRSMTLSSTTGINLSNYSVSYVGEFLERHEERGYSFGDLEKVAVALWYGVTKYFLRETHINEYQLVLLEKEIADWYSEIESNLFHFAMSLIKKDDSYMEKIVNPTFEELCSMLYISSLDTNEIDAKDLISRYAYLFENVSILEEANIPWFVEILRFYDYKIFLGGDKETRNKTFDIFVKGIEGKFTAKKVIETLECFGFNLVKREELNYIIKSYSNVGELKKQKQLINCLIALAESKDDFDEIDKYILAHILRHNYFEVNMEYGSVSNMASALTHYGIIEKCRNLSNLEYMVRLISNNGIYSSGSLHFNLDDEDVFARILTIDKAVENEIAENRETSVMHLAIERAINVLGARENTTKEDMLALKEKLEKGFNLNDLKEIFKLRRTYDTKKAYAFLCDFEIFDAFEDYKDGLVLKPILLDYFHQCQKRCKYLATKYAYENGLDVIELFNSETFSRNLSRNCLYLENCLNEELREFIEIIAECALEKGNSYFRSFLLNLMLNESTLFRKIYSEEEIQDIYATALELTKSISNSYYGGFYTESTYNNLVIYYMSEEEKARIAEEEEKERLRKELEDKARREEAAKEDIKESLEVEFGKNASNEQLTSFAGYVRINRALDYSTRQSDAYFEYLKLVVANAAILSKHMSSYFSLLGNLIEKERISLELAKKYVANLTIIEENKVEESDVNVA